MADLVAERRVIMFFRYRAELRPNLYTATSRWPNEAASSDTELCFRPGLVAALP